MMGSWCFREPPLLREGPVAAVDLHGEPDDPLPPWYVEAVAAVPETREINGGMSSETYSPGCHFSLLMLLHGHCWTGVPLTAPPLASRHNPLRLFT